MAISISTIKCNDTVMFKGSLYVVTFINEPINYITIRTTSGNSPSYMDVDCHDIYLEWPYGSPKFLNSISTTAYSSIPSLPSNFDSNTPKRNPCECGAHATFMPDQHSSWCPMFRQNQ